MATTLTTAHMQAALTDNNVTTPTIDGNAAADSSAYAVIQMVYEMMTTGVSFFLTDGAGELLIDQEGNVLTASI